MDTLRKYIRKVLKENFVEEEFSIVNNTLEVKSPYENVQKTIMGDKTIYILFGNIDYYKGENREAILAIKRKSNEVNLDGEFYKNFLSEFKTRFNSISELRESEMLISVESTSPTNDDMANSLGIPYVKNGFLKNDSNFKMRSVKPSERGSVKDLFKLNANVENKNRICIMDDFITSGSTFKNAFDKLPIGVNAVGVCLFKLIS